MRGALEEEYFMKLRNAAFVAAGFAVAIFSAPLGAQELSDTAFLAGSWTEK